MIYRNIINNRLYDVTSMPDEKGLCGAVDLAANQCVLVRFDELEQALIYTGDEAMDSALARMA